ncbi:tetratricopeptide repeat protein [Natronoglycomyces albus]|uniref:Tetratricopeptide repeat protein n=1 Tax=Natronoglycomyces albus TaxID=2811108 RepID=A0A895XQN4_9ACTN|nr:tetratricopeptide repeat protein [Natronoglycomyces albus]QSB05679.1 tetratricopeptide repeat protein [Natronoglycomyces albus]
MSLSDFLDTAENGRMYTTDAEGLRAWIAATSTGAVNQPLLRQHGIGFILLEEYDRAISTLTEVLARADSHARRMAALINLGDAYRYSGHRETAAELYQRAIGIAHVHSRDYLDFALQHYGKHLTEAGDVTAALAVLEEALTLRKEAGDADLIASTEQAIDYAKSIAQHH